MSTNRAASLTLHTCSSILDNFRVSGAQQAQKVPKHISITPKYYY